MNENMLVSLDDAALDEVNGGLSLSLGVNDTTVVGASVDLKDGIGASLTLLGKKIGFKLGISFG
ncbi:MAG: hypothetical protein QM778_22675 [Myxococcales bacterium]